MRNKTISGFALVSYFVIPIVIFLAIEKIFITDTPLLVFELGLLLFLIRFFGVLISATLYVALIAFSSLASLIPLYHLTWNSAKKSLDDLLLTDGGHIAALAILVSMVCLFIFVVIHSLKKISNSMLLVVAIIFICFNLLIKYLEAPYFKEVLVTSVIKNSYQIYNNQKNMRVKNNVPLVKIDSGTKDIFDLVENQTEALPKKILLIVVESLGHSMLEGNKANYWQVHDPLDAIKSSSKFNVSVSSIRAYGSTIPGEIRELCGFMIDGIQVPDTLGLSRCLPNQLAMLGYKTTAFHGFKSGFFDRSSVYPKLGFQTSIFESGIDRTDRICGYMFFTGVCDVDVANHINKNLRASDSDEKEFLYWLTLNGHQPTLGPPKAGNFKECIEMEMDSGNLCWLVQHSQSTINSAISILLENPHLNVIIVGDHGPAADLPQFRENFVPVITITPNTGN